MLIAFIISYTLLIFPIFIRFYGEIDKETKKLKYKIKLFRFITIFFGYAEFIDEGIAVHVNNIKAYIIYYKEFFAIHNKIKPLKDYHLYRLKSVISIGSSANDKMLTFIIIYNAIVNAFGYTINKIKPYVKIKNDVNVYYDTNMFNVKFNFVIVLNLLMIFLSFIKVYLEKMFYAIKRQPN